MRHIYKIDDGEIFWYSAENEEDAFRIFKELYTDPEDRSGVEITELPDDYELSIYLDYPYQDPSAKTTKTCREWADETEGEIATTLY